MKQDNAKKKPSFSAQCAGTFTGTFLWGLGFSLAIGTAGIVIDAVVGRR